MSKDTETLFALFGSALNGTLSEEQRLELSARLRSDPAARARWFAYNDVDCALGELPACLPEPSSSSATPSAHPSEAKKERAPRRWLWASAAAAAAVVLGGVEQARHSGQPERVARFTSLQDALWASPSAAFRRGETLRKGQVLELLSGEVQIQFESGAQVNLYAPCIFKATSENGGFLTYGKLRARSESPESRGFVIQTPTARMVDIGTEFIASASADGQSRVEVTSGEVKVHLPGQAEPRSVLQGESFAIETGAQKVLTRIEAGDGSPAFVLPSIEPPSSNISDAPASGSFSARLLRGAEPTAPDSNALSRSAQESAKKTPKDDVRIINQKDGRIVMDLGSLIAVTKINAYSWRRGQLFENESRRPAQKFVLYASDREAPPMAAGNLEAQGWQMIGRVDSDKFFGVENPKLRSEQQACSFTSATGCLGRYRYLLWLPSETASDDTLADLKSAASSFEVYAEPWSF
jgi:hypothetical protein